MLGETASVAFSLCNDDLLSRSFRDSVDLALRHGAESSAASAGENRNPAALMLRRAADRKAWEECVSILLRAGAMLDGCPETAARIRKAGNASAWTEAALRLLASCPDPAKHRLVAARMRFLFEDETTEAKILTAGRTVAGSNALLCDDLARLHRALGGSAAAAAALDAFRLSPTPERGFVAARLALQAGGKEGAIVLIRETAAIPDFRWHAAAALLCESAGRDEEAIGFARRAFERGESPNALLARLLEAQGKLEEALRFYERDLAHGSRMTPGPHDDWLPPLPQPAARSSAEGRSRILAALGREDGK